MPTLANAATEHDSEFDELLALNPGVSASELASALDAESSEKGMSVQEYARSVLAEQRAAKEKYESEMQDMQIGGGGADLASIDGTAGATYLLPKSDYVGDVYWSPGVPHYGHVGIFSGRDWIVEAAGKPGGSNWDWVWNVTVPSGTVLFTSTPLRRPKTLRRLTPTTICSTTPTTGVSGRTRSTILKV